MVDQNFPEGEMRKVNITGRQDSVERASKMVDELISGEPGSAQAIIQKVHLPHSAPELTPSLRLIRLTFASQAPGVLHKAR